MRSERTLGGRRLTAGPRVDLHRLPKGPAQRLEAAFGDMVRIRAVEGLDVDAGARIGREGVVELLEELRVHVADLWGREGGAPDQVGPVRQVDGAAGQGLVHRDDREPEAPDAPEVPKGLADRLAQDDPDILHRVMKVDVQVALRLDVKVEGAVPPKGIQHVVQEADPGFDPGPARTVQVDLLFANEDEALALFETDDLAVAVDGLRTRTRLAAITRSARGSLLAGDGEVVSIPALPVEKVVDTTGAGDQYAAGVMYGLAAGQPLESCGRLGAMAAAEVISHFGPRPQVSLRELAAREGL